MESLKSWQIQRAEKTLKEHILRSYHAKSYQDAWRNLPEIPMIGEIQPRDENGRVFADSLPQKPSQDIWNDYQGETAYSYNPNIPVNIIDGPWPSQDQYVGAHYEMLREDAIASLRRSVAEVSSYPNMANNDETCIYTHVTVVGIHLRRNNAAFRVAFSTERTGKQINWKQCKRLLQGSLVALSPQDDHFRTICKLAVVASRDLIEQDPPVIDLCWSDPEEAVFDPVEKYMMVECRDGFFEASRHILVGMQKLMTEKCKLMNHITLLDRKAQPPPYLQKQPFCNLTSLEPPQVSDTYPQHQAMSDRETSRDNLWNVNVLEDFPEKLNSSMDSSQLDACRSMLTKQVAIVQGPPGTGKTFTSVVAIRVLIENLRDNDPPLIIAAQTNHALDQLLNLIMKFENRVVRLGGRSDKENTEILKRTLYQLRTSNPDVPNGAAGINRCKSTWKKLVKDIKAAINPLVQSDLLLADQLLEHSIISQAQCDSLHEAQDEFDKVKGSEWNKDDDSESGEEREQPRSRDIADWVGIGQLMEIPCTPLINRALPIEEEELGYVQAKEFSEELTQGQDFANEDAPQDEWIPFRRRLTGRNASQLHEGEINKLLRGKSNLNQIQKELRGEIYRHWEDQVNEIVLKKLRNLLIEYQKHVQEYQVVKGVCSFKLMHHLGIKVIACTTTGLSKYRGIISAMRPRTLLIEEAAETGEGSIIGGLVETLEQIILVGDHQQLQARCSVRALEEAPYYLKVSMFERLVNNGFPFIMLNTQRRMIPTIRKLLCIEPNPFYRNLQDHESVLDRVRNRPPIPGMGGKDVYFFHHNWPEARNLEYSCFNLDEAQMIAGFFIYLTLNGVDLTKITVLTFYQGQRKVIIDQLIASQHFPPRTPFKVFTVDSYQGEENDIILLSLVRSNESSSVGFLDSKNRLVVALSRARRGLYLFGNTVTLASSESTEEKQGREALWDPLIQYLRKRNSYAIDGGFPITCARHGNIVRITDPAHWLGRAGGCDLKCDSVRRCGHECRYLCHPFDHDEVSCKEPCTRILGCGHGCSEECGKHCHCTACELAERQMVSAYSWAECDAQTREVLYDDGDEALDSRIKQQEQTTKKSQITGKNRHVFFSEAGPRRDFNRNDRFPNKTIPEPGSSGSSSGQRYFSDSTPKATRKESSKMGESPRESQETGKEISPSRRKAPALSSSAIPAKSSPSSWQAWNAQKADREMAEKRDLGDAAVPAIDRSKLVFSERYVPVTIENNKRCTNTKAAVKSTVARNDAGVTGVVQPLQQAIGFARRDTKSSDEDLIDFKAGSDRQASQSSSGPQIKIENSVRTDAPFIQLTPETGLCEPNEVQQPATMHIPGLPHMWQMPIMDDTRRANSLLGPFNSLESRGKLLNYALTSGDDDHEKCSFSADDDRQALLPKSSKNSDKKGVSEVKLKRQSPPKSYINLPTKESPSKPSKSSNLSASLRSMSLSGGLKGVRNGIDPMEEMINLNEFLADGPLHVVEPKLENWPKSLFD